MTEQNANKPLVLKKHINAIHCTNNMSFVQRKLFNALLYYAYRDLPNKKIFEIPAKKLCELIGYNSNDYKSLKKALKAMMSIVIEWNVTDYETNNANKWSSSTMLAAATLENGMCRYEYSETLKELLYRPEIYGRINIEVQTEFSSTYALAIYENCVRYRGLPQTPWFDLEVFRKLMGLTDDKYSSYKELRKRVIDIGIREVNQFADISIVPEVNKCNKKIVSIRFKLQEKQSENIAFTPISADLNLADSLINEFKITPEVAKEILSTYEADYIKEKISLVLDSPSFKTGKIEGVSGFLIRAIQDNYQPAKSSKVIKKKTEVNQLAIQKEKADNLEAQKKKAYEEYLRKHVDECLLKFDKQMYDSTTEKFIQHLSYLPEGSIYIQTYKTHGMNSSFIASKFRQYLLEKLPHMFYGLLSYEDFLADAYVE